MRVVVHERPILETARLALVGVADDGLGPTLGIQDCSEFPTGGEAGASAAGQATVIDDADQLLRGHRTHGPFQSHVSAGSAVALERLSSRVTDVRENTLLDTVGRWRWYGSVARLERVGACSDQRLLAA